ncbi:MAG TPA: 2-C-methyl-D-erythritol 2,4-cyclodiphosphate synthase [Bacilli bacterium]|mgnify:FL=1|nr:2-C-methyl-D-erythritol 2,4-cyclodiphosphate synthase [Bacilli bacterium]HPX83041.1 2-C-methyl-D-erythritol 2,4-cyclodiphosphate synthase [Bacilli bacterium]
MFDVIIVAAGSSTRFGENKILLDIHSKPLIIHTIEIFKDLEDLKQIILVIKKEDQKEIEKILKEYDLDLVVTFGGKTRSESVVNGLKKVTSDYVLVHDGARCITLPSDVLKVLEEMKKHQAAFLMSFVSDSLYYEEKLIDRSKAYFSETPQGFKTEILKEAFSLMKKEYPDEVSLVQDVLNIEAKKIKSNNFNIKITEPKDYTFVMERFVKRNLIGESLDIHPFEFGKSLYIGGIKIPYHSGAKAHSDGDVLLHAISEAILGALGKGDLGSNFPDTDPKYKDISSIYFLERVKEILEKEKTQIVNIDATIYLEAPQINSYLSKMEELIAHTLEIDQDKVNIKATHFEGLGMIGEGKGLGSRAVVLLEKHDLRQR